MQKVYVKMNADFFPDGKVLPNFFIFDYDNIYEVFEIEHIKDIEPMASLKAGGFGTRYTVIIRGREKYLWLEDNGIQWFVEYKH